MGSMVTGYNPSASPPYGCVWIFICCTMNTIISFYLALNLRLSIIAPETSFCASSTLKSYPTLRRSISVEYIFRSTQAPIILFWPSIKRCLTPLYVSPQFSLWRACICKMRNMASKVDYYGWNKAGDKMHTKLWNIGGGGTNSHIQKWTVLRLF